MREKLHYLLCGLAMGAADVVPGVSGGTIAFITGIYDKLLNGIKAFNATFFRLFFSGKWKDALALIPWGFLLPLLAGIVTSIFSLARLTLYLLHTWPEALWAFFFGLIISSIILMTRGLRMPAANVVLLVLGAVFAWFITGAEAMSAAHTLPHIFVAGFIALCAMILPGISGSFMLVIMGQYAYILSAVVHLDLPVLFTFIAGGLCGLMSFSRVLSACFRRYPSQTSAALIGVMAGSLRTVWPWHNGTWPALPPAMDGMVVVAALTCACGVALPLLVQRIANAAKQAHGGSANES
ncbi:DUF368 domain-containing protein [Mailhella massiliensis]|uniref:DUF368 domain-containing protein n=1 Tax=Mailhella massiliensis TaxID=1903261 RepID=UPI00097DAD98|nr:DUF368 domain-containing protein [Mailhella massiliensis]